jgi:SAM-dependent methyltransferase
MPPTCPACASERCIEFYTVRGVPTNSCLLVSDRQRALEFPTGDIGLTLCQGCGFIFNALWHADRTIYSDTYEETQGFSSTFNAFQRRLAEELIERHNLREKDVLEIGCGKGEFLSLICKLGRNRGVGYDPAFVPARFDGATENIRFIRDFFTETTTEPAPDFLCCKMTLEHISETRHFVHAVRRVASAEHGTVVFFQIPDVRRILDETAFWDVYYEHCSYFSPASLEYLFRHAGFEVLRTSTGYDGQYLMIEARATADGGRAGSTAEERHEIKKLCGQIAGFADAATSIIGEWRDRLRQSKVAGHRTVLWGSGSKAVAFLTTIGIRDEIDYVVDINPFRQGRFIPGAGQQIVPPSFLAQYQPDLVVVMNPIYCNEVGAELDRQGISAEIVAMGRYHRPREEPAASASARVAV